MLLALAGCAPQPWQPDERESHIETAEIYLGLGDQAFAAGRLPEALNDYRTVLQHRLALEDHDGAALTQLRLADTYVLLGLVEEALEMSRQALDKARTPAVRAAALYKIAALYYDETRPSLGDKRESAAYAAEARELAPPPQRKLMTPEEAWEFARTHNEWFGARLMQLDSLLAAGRVEEAAQVVLPPNAPIGYFHQLANAWEALALKTHDPAWARKSAELWKNHTPQSPYTARRQKQAAALVRQLGG
jgi:tetratricopeptide (TPR) repeat protein